MPSLAVYHPQVVHFAIALLLVGVLFRLISLTPFLAWTRQAAAALLIMGTVASAVSVQSGIDAHGPVERIPGARPAVVEHEELGIAAKNIFLAVAAIEIVALVMGAGYAGAKAAGYVKYAHVASLLVGAYGSFMLYEAAEHGGELVYSYAGGPGLRSGEPEDVQRLLLAGLYSQSQADRRAGNGAAAARLVDEMASRFPADTTIRFLQVESLLLDVKDPARALAAARAVSVDEKSARWATRKASLTADAFMALQQPDSAKAALRPVVEAFPQNTRLKAKLDSIP